MFSDLPPPDERSPSLRARLRALVVGPELDAGLAASFRAETDEATRRRLRVLLPIFAAGHAAHVAVFRAGADVATVGVRGAEWRNAVAGVHAGSLVVALALAAVAWKPRGGWLGRDLSPLTAAAYVLHGALIAGADQLNIPSATPFIGYCLGVPIVVTLTPVSAAGVYALGLATYVVAIFTMQPSADFRLALLPNGFSSVVVGVTLAVLFHAARRKDFAQRAIIRRQREELAAMNADLERRVEAQVSEIVRRAEEVERLNAQLSSQVRSRSAELSVALERLAGLRPPEEGLARGTVLGGRFEVGHLIGAGGMGTVHTGVDRTTGAEVAIKVTRSRPSQNLDEVQRFLAEARSAASVEHPAVVRMLHVDVSDDGLFYQVQELVRGTTLAERLEDGRAWPPGTAARCGALLADALAAAHAKGLVHRDVKPANVMLTPAAPGLKLLDFGIAKLVDDGHGTDGLTRPGAIVGTPAYMAPEQIKGGAAVTDRADVYALGLVLFALFTGRHPFASGAKDDVLLAHLFDEPPSIRAFEPSLPEAMAQLVARCLAKSPAERPSAAELAADLERFADSANAPGLDELPHDVTRREVHHPPSATAVRNAETERGVVPKPREVGRR